MAPRTVTLADKVASLLEPACYPQETRTVQAVETHMSWVFLTDAHAYKLKKPVHDDLQDASTVERRRFLCQEELRLNRRLAPDVYLDVVPLVLAADGRIAVGGGGTTVDWLVRMRRLPSGSMLDALLARRAATPAQMQAVAVRLAAFHRSQPPAPLDGPAYRALLLRRIAQSQQELCDPAWALPAERIASLCARQRELLADCAADVDGRLGAGRVVEGHGDLRPEHVSLGEPLAVIDCLEFSAELRMLDGLDEIGFLALECERMHAGALAGVLLRAYGQASGDPMPGMLLHFYQSCRAGERARLAIRHLREPRYRPSSVWRGRTLRYLALAARHLRACTATSPAAGP
jgi:aminoglycoside phosphotransferase family enzyme